MSRLSEVVDRLAGVIESRKGADGGGSYTAQLLKDPARAAKKLGEEAVETVIAAVSADRAAIVAESADLLFHLTMLWADAGVAPAEVLEALEARRGVSGIDEKAARETR